jgi:uncharacterized protein
MSDDQAFESGADREEDSSAATLPLPRVDDVDTGPAAVVAAFYDALLAEDAPAALCLLSPGIVWYEMPEGPYARQDGTPYRGAAEIVENVLGPQIRDVEGLRMVQHELLAYGNTIIALGTAVGQGRKTGAGLEIPFAHVWVVQGDSIVEFRQYVDPAVFRAAVDQHSQPGVEV